jgi:hypothetical protein
MGNFIPTELTEFFGISDESLLCFTQATYFIITGTILRWTIKTYEKNAFNKEVSRDNIGRSDVLKICKFCQIIRNKDTLFFEDDKVAVFKDMTPQAAKHFLITPKDHIKNINDVQPRHKELITHMKRVAL